MVVEQKIQIIVVIAISAMFINTIVFVEAIVYLVTEVVVEQLSADHGHEHRPHHDRHAHLVASCFVSSPRCFPDIIRLSFNIGSRQVKKSDDVKCKIYF